MNHPWYELPHGWNPDLWCKAVREVASLVGDKEALTWAENKFWADLVDSASGPLPDRYAQLFDMLGVM